MGFELVGVVRHVVSTLARERVGRVGTRQVLNMFKIPANGLSRLESSSSGLKVMRVDTLLRVVTLLRAVYSHNGHWPLHTNTIPSKFHAQPYKGL